MKIERQVPDGLVQFSAIEMGEAFVVLTEGDSSFIGSRLYICTIGNDAVNLVSGMLRNFHDDELVRPVAAKVVIEE